MANVIVNAVYGFLGLLLIIELGLTGYLVHATEHFTPSQFSFMLFNSIWSILVLIYLAVTFNMAARMAMVSVGLLALTVLFWFAGSIAISVYVGIPHCDGNNFCQSAQASCAFGFFCWAVFTGLALVETLAYFRGGSGGKSSMGV